MSINRLHVMLHALFGLNILKMHLFSAGITLVDRSKSWNRNERNEEYIWLELTCLLSQLIIYKYYMVRGEIWQTRWHEMLHLWNCSGGLVVKTFWISLIYQCSCFLFSNSIGYYCVRVCVLVLYFNFNRHFLLLFKEVLFFVFHNSYIYSWFSMHCPMTTYWGFWNGEEKINYSDMRV